MTRQTSQGLWAPGGATLRLPPRMRLARSERERLWKGLERFVNCEDSEDEYGALGRAFPEFWPVEVWHYPVEEQKQQYSPIALAALPRVGDFIVPPEQKESTGYEEVTDEELAEASRTDSLNWHPTCHKLFLFYRDTLRDVWGGKEETAWFGGREEFLLGLSSLNEVAHDEAKKSGDMPVGLFTLPFELFVSWRRIIDQFSTAAEEGSLKVSMLWQYGDFYLVPRNDFQRAFYLLFRQGWRARVCPRCKVFFVARRSKQTFCGTSCSAGSRLASKRKWWRNVGAKRRSGERETDTKRIHNKRKHR